MRKLISKKKLQQSSEGAGGAIGRSYRLAQAVVLGTAPSTSDDLLDTRHLMAVRCGTRQLSILSRVAPLLLGPLCASSCAFCRLASLRACGVEVRVVTANLLGDAAVDALANRNDTCPAQASRAISTFLIFARR